MATLGFISRLHKAVTERLDSVDPPSQQEVTLINAPSCLTQRIGNGFVDSALESSFQSWYIKNYLRRVDFLAAVVCITAHLAIFNHFRSAGPVWMTTWLLSCLFTIGYLCVMVRNKQVWKTYRRPLLLIRRIVLPLLFRHLYSAVSQTPTVSSHLGLAAQLVHGSAAIRLLILVICFPDLFHWLAPSGLLSVFTISRVATALCGSPLGGSLFARTVVTQLHSYLLLVQEMVTGRHMQLDSVWQSECTQVVHASQAIVGFVLPMTCLYMFETHCRQVFLSRHFGRQLEVDYGVSCAHGSPVQRAAELVELVLVFLALVACAMIVIMY